MYDFSGYSQTKYPGSPQCAVNALLSHKNSPGILGDMNLSYWAELAFAITLTLLLFPSEMRTLLSLVNSAPELLNMR